LRGGGYGEGEKVGKKKKTWGIEKKKQKERYKRVTLQKGWGRRSGFYTGLWFGKKKAGGQKRKTCRILSEGALKWGRGGRQ